MKLRFGFGGFVFIVLTGSLLTTAVSAPATAPAVSPKSSREPSTEASIPLWNGKVPGGLGNAPIDIPTLTIFRLPFNKASGASFIVCPGGAYGHPSAREGKPVALWLNTIGINAFVLKYRLGPKYHHPAELEDVQRAVRLVRSRSKEWGLDPNRIGVLGFSAGGHLASSVATHFDAGNPDAADPIEQASCRPDLAILIYPVITMMDPYTHKESRQNLLGKNPDPKLMTLMSNDQQVTAQTPPCFVVATQDDQTVPIQNSLMFVAACHDKGVPIEFHMFEHGRHGFAMGGTDPELSSWPEIAGRWLDKHGYLTKPPSVLPHLEP